MSWTSARAPPAPAPAPAAASRPQRARAAASYAEGSGSDSSGDEERAAAAAPRVREDDDDDDAACGDPAAAAAATAVPADARKQQRYAEVARALFDTCRELKTTFQRVTATGLAPPMGVGGAPRGSRVVMVTRQPHTLAAGHVLKPHQLIGLNWLLAVWSSGASGILADDMGLGKTIQIAAFFAQLQAWHTDDHSSGNASGSSSAAAMLCNDDGAAGSSASASLDAPSPAALASLARLLHTASAADSIVTPAHPAATAATTAATTAAAAAAPFRVRIKARDGSTSDAAFSLKAAVRAAAKAGMRLQLPAHVLAALQGASAAGATSIQQQHASAAAAAASSAAAAGADDDEEGEDDDDEGSGSDGSDAEFGDDGRRIRRAGAGRRRAAAAARATALSGQPTPFIDNVFRRSSMGPHLVVVPTSVLANWVRELAAWCPSLPVVLFAGSQAERKAAKKALPTAAVVVASYSLLEKPDTATLLASTDWQVLVLDEAHGLKNAGSLRFKHAMALPARCRVLLTGTPVQNNVGELVSLLRFLVPDMFVSYERGGFTINERYEEDGDAGGVDGEDAEAAGLVEAMKVEVLRLGKAAAAGGSQRRGDKSGGGGGGDKGKGASASSSSSSSVAAAGGGDGASVLAAPAPASPLQSSDAAVSAALTDITSVFILRRTKAQVDLSLPPKTRVTSWAAMTPFQVRVAATLHAVTLALAPQGGLGQAVREALDAPEGAAAGPTGGDAPEGAAAVAAQPTASPHAPRRPLSGAGSGSGDATGAGGPQAEHSASPAHASAGAGTGGIDEELVGGSPSPTPAAASGAAACEGDDGDERLPQQGLPQAGLLLAPLATPLQPHARAAAAFPGPMPSTDAPAETAAETVAAAAAPSFDDPCARAPGSTGARLAPPASSMRHTSDLRVTFAAASSAIALAASPSAAPPSDSSSSSCMDIDDSTVFDATSSSSSSSSSTRALPGALSLPPPAVVGPVFIGELARVFGESGGEGGGGAAAQQVTGQVGRIVMLLRKVAMHPLLLRCRYSNAAVLAVARCLWELGNDREPPMADASCLPHDFACPPPAAADDDDGAAELATGAAGSGGLRARSHKRARSDVSASGSASGGIGSSCAPMAAAAVAQAAVLRDAGRAGAVAGPPQAEGGGDDGALEAGSRGAQHPTALQPHAQQFLRAVAAAHAPVSRAQLMAWAAEHVGPVDGVPAAGSSTSGAAPSSSKGASSSSSSSSSCGPPLSSAAAAKALGKAVNGLADLAESLLSSSDYQLHARVSDWAAVSPAAARLCLPDAAFLDAGKVAFLGALLASLPLKPTPDTVAAAAAATGAPRRRGAGASASAAAAAAGAGPPTKHYASRVLVFSQFTLALDVLGDALLVLGHSHARIDGSTPAAARQGIIDAFAADDTVPVFLLSTRAGGVGLNLTAADTVVIHDCDWNPLNDAQAEDRAHRMGQTRAVTVYRTLSPGTIECHMTSTAAGKMELVGKLMTLSEKTSTGGGGASRGGRRGTAAAAAL